MTSDLSGSLDSGPARPSGRFPPPRPGTSGYGPVPSGSHLGPASGFGPAASGFGPTGSHPGSHPGPHASSGLGPAGSHPGPGGSSFAGRPTSSRAGSVAGRRFGAYVLQQELGRGSNGVVYLAQREGAETACALKVLKEDLAQDEELLRRFQLEAAVTFKLAHPGVVRMLDAGVVGGHHFYAMEYCPGETLSQRLVRGPLTPEEARRLVLELARTMGHAHGLGVLHRDIKPSNVILDPGSGRPRLADFGLSRDRSLARSLTRSGDVLGTPAYMSPEQFRGQKDVDERVDVYGLGAVLYECLTGRRPFPSGTLTELAQQVLEGTLTPPRALAPDVPPALDVVCVKALARERSERYRTAEEMARALEAAAPDPVGRASGRLRTSARLGRGGGAGEGLRQRLQPHLAWIVAAALLVLGGAGGALVALGGGAARAARAAIVEARRLVDGTGEPEALVAAVDAADAAAKAAQDQAFLDEVAALREDLARLGRVDQLLAERAPGPEALQALAAELAARSAPAGAEARPPARADRWSRLSALVAARHGLLQLALDNDRRRPVTEVAAALEALREQAGGDQRLAPLLRREETRLDARRALEAAREKWRLAWREQPMVLAALERAEAAARGVDEELLAEAELDRARYLLRRGRLEEAAELGARLMRTPGRIGGEAGFVCGTALAWQGWWMEALQVLQNVLDTQPRESVPALKAIAMVRANPGQPESAQPYARRALELDPQDAEAATLLAQAMAFDGDVQGGLAELERIAARAPDDTRVWVTRMLISDEAGDAAGCDAALARVNELSPGTSWVWLLRGLTRVMPRGMRGRGMRDPREMERRMNGIQDLNRFQEQNPRDPRPKLFSAAMSMMGGEGNMFQAMAAVREIYAEEPAMVTRMINNLPDPRMQAMARQMLGIR